jgi:hypothetical protein
MRWWRRAVHPLMATLVRARVWGLGNCWCNGDVTPTVEEQRGHTAGMVVKWATIPGVIGAVTDLES